jgi:DNA-binding MarR family transcriptional regulator
MGTNEQVKLTTNDSEDIGLDVLDFWREVVLATVRQDGPDLTQRQMAVLLTVYLNNPPHTVRGLAEILGASKPAITRALDTLGQKGLLKRKRDETDKRNVLVQRTVKGSIFLSEFSDTIKAGKLRARDK